MNTKLESLFEKYNISEKNRFEIRNFYMFLDEWKKHNLLNNFELLATRLKKIETDIQTEKDILIWQAVDRVKNYIIEKRKNNINSDIKKDIDLLKGDL